MPLTVMAEGWAPDLRKITITRENPKFDFRLKAGKTLRIRFEDDSGKPIPGVGVLIEGWRGGKSLYNQKHPIVLDTKIPGMADKNGIYQWNWAPDDPVYYYFGKAGYEERRSQPLTADGTEQKVTMTRLPPEESGNSLQFDNRVRPSPISRHARPGRQRRILAVGGLPYGGQSDATNAPIFRVPAHL